MKQAFSETLVKEKIMMLYDLFQKETCKTKNSQVIQVKQIDKPIPHLYSLQFEVYYASHANWVQEPETNGFGVEH